jgi:hypothetical protein
MPVSDLEKISFDTLDVNDGVNFSLEELTLKSAEKRPEWADNPDADGAALVQEPHYTPAYFEGQIRVVKAEDTDTALEALGELIDALQSMERTAGGLPIPWTPNGSTKALTWYALLGELVEVPITVTGDLAGWFINFPVVKFKLTCRPFGYREERVALAAVVSSAPMQVVYVEGIEGDVAAEGTLRITDKAAQDRRYMEWGQDLVESAEGNPPLELEADEDLVVEGYAGELAGKTGSVSTKVVKATLSPTAVVLCSTGPITHIGSYRNKLRCQADGEGARFHVSYRVGDGVWVTSLPWMTPGQVDQWFDLDQGEIFLEEAEQGEQVSEIRIEGKVEEEAKNCTGWVDVLGLMPTRRYGVAREPLNFDVPTSLQVVDGFNQAEGNATGKSPEVGSPYAAMPISDTSDFTVAAGELRRTATEDTGTIGTAPFKGRGIGTAKELTNVAIRNWFLLNGFTFAAGGFSPQTGHIVSYLNNESFIIVRVYIDWPAYYGTGPGAFGLYLRIQKPDGTYLANEVEVPVPTGLPTGSLLSLVIGNSLSVFMNDQQLVTVTDPMIGLKGKAYLYDESVVGTGGTRRYDNLAIWVPDQPVVCASGQSLDIRADGEQRENSGGTYWSPVRYRGAHCLLDPAGNSDLVNRLAVKMRRNDAAEEPDTNLTDEQSLEVLVRERFLAPR